jgi:hypothetical protein
VAAVHLRKRPHVDLGSPLGRCRLVREVAAVGRDSSNVKAIEVGSTVVYAQAAGPASLDSDIVLDLPGPGNNTAFGHCALDFATGIGLCTFSGGTGKFTHFQARANVSYLGGHDWAWDGTYSFSPRD